MARTGPTKIYILDKARIFKSCLFLEQYKALIVSDLHIGFEELLISSGWLIPRTSFNDMFELLQEAVLKLKPDITIINGDLKHEFGVVNRQEWGDITRLLEWLKSHTRVVLIKGNHDILLKPVAKKQGLELFESYELGEYFIAHGDKLLTPKKASTIIIGHEHAAVSIRTSTRVERFKAFIKTRWKNKTLILMPAFFPLTEGTDLLQEQAKSPYLKDIDFNNAELWLLDKHNKPLYFGRWKDLKKIEKMF